MTWVDRLQAWSQAGYCGANSLVDRTVGDEAATAAIFLMFGWNLGTPPDPSLPHWITAMTRIGPFAFLLVLVLAHHATRRANRRRSTLPAPPAGK